MKRLIIWIFIFLLSMAQLFPYQKKTRVLEFREDDSRVVYTLDCHKDYHIFIELERKETIKCASIGNNSSWETGRDGPYIWIKPAKGAKKPVYLTVLSESGKLYQFQLTVIENAESLYLKTFITGGENEW